MSNMRTAVLVPAIAAALVVPSAVLAGATWHFTGGEAGFTFYPDHVPGTKTRADVLRELQQAKADGSYRYLERGLPLPPPSTGAGKTREAVIEELVNVTLEERARMNALYSNN